MIRAQNNMSLLPWRDPLIGRQHSLSRVIMSQFSPYFLYLTVTTKYKMPFSAATQVIPRYPTIMLRPWEQHLTAPLPIKFSL